MAANLSTISELPQWNMRQFKADEKENAEMINVYFYGIVPGFAGANHVFTHLCSQLLLPLV
jgi:hypothetical protein